MRPPTFPILKLPPVHSPAQPITLPPQIRASCIYALLPIRSGAAKTIDYSGRGHHGALTDVSWITKGRRGPALYFAEPGGGIDTGADWIGTGALTIIFSHWADGYGGAGDVILIANNKMYVECTEMFTNVFITSDNLVHYAVSAPGLVMDGRHQIWVFTRTAAGIANIYLADTKKSPTRSGLVDQDSGTPIPGTTNVYIGNRSIMDAGFDGAMDMVLVFDQVLPLSMITDIWRWIVA